MPAAMAVLAAAALALSACGGGTDTKPTAGQSAVASPTPDAPKYKTLGKAELTAVLLPLDAMPVGYSEDSSEQSSGDKTFCEYKQPFNARSKVSKNYIKGGGFNSELIGVGLRQYATVEQASASFEALEKALQTCKQEISDGEKLTYSVMNLPKAGDRSLGVRIESRGATVLQGFSLVGPVLVNAGSGGLMKADADLVANLLNKQVDRYTTAAK
jgi:hypothetical protein